VVLIGIQCVALAPFPPIYASPSDSNRNKLLKCKEKTVTPPKVPRKNGARGLESRLIVSADVTHPTKFYEFLKLAPDFLSTPASGLT